MTIGSRIINLLSRIKQQNWSYKSILPVAFGGVAAIVALSTLGATSMFTTWAAITGAALAGRFIGEAVDNKITLQMTLNERGLKPPPILLEIERKRDGSFSYTLKNVLALNLDDMAQGVDNYITGSEAEVDFSGRPRYTVSFDTNGDITRGELEFGNFSSLNPIVTTEQNEEVEGVDKTTILNYLQTVPMFLGGKFTDPEETIAHGNRRKTTTEISQTAAPSHDLESKEFFDRLINLAIVTGRFKEILSNFGKTMITQQDRSMVFAKLTKDVEDHIRESHSFLTKPSGTHLAIGIIATIGLVAIASIPGVNAIVAGVCAILGIASGIFSFFKGLLLKKKYDKDKKFQREKTEAENRLANLEENLGESFVSALNVIENYSSSNEQTLSLENQNITDTCAQVISRWICSPAGSTCTELKLSVNKITSTGAKFIAEAIKNSTHIQNIDLSGNTIGQEGVVAIKDALLENFSVTDLQYDTNEASQELQEEIEKQLLINGYLQGKTDLNIRGYFNSDDELRTAAIEKIIQTQNLFCLQALENSTLDNPAVNKAILQTHLTIMFQENTPHLLTDYIAIYNEIGTENLFGLVDQNKVLLSVQAVLSSPEQNLTNLKEMQDADRTDLLQRCLAENDPTKKPVAILMSKLIGNPDPSTPEIATLQRLTNDDNNLEMLLGLIKDDVRNNNCRILKTFDMAQRVELIEAALIQEAPRKAHAHGIATLAAQLIDIEIPDRYIKNIFPEPERRVTIETPGSGWSFNAYIDALKSYRDTIRNTNSPLAIINQIIQTGLQEDLRARRRCCLMGERSEKEQRESFQSLSKELNENYDITSFDFGAYPVQDYVKERIQFICSRNQMIRNLNRPGLFMNSYKQFASDECEEALATINGSDLERVVLENLSNATSGTDERPLLNHECQLRTLDDPHRIALLERYFAGEPEARNKALLISELIKNDVDHPTYNALFAPGEQCRHELIREIGHEIYKALTPTQHHTGRRRLFRQPETEMRTSTFEELKTSLEAILKRVNQTNMPPEMQERIKTRIENALDLTAPKPIPLPTEALAKLFAEPARQQPQPTNESTRQTRSR